MFGQRKSRSKSLVVYLPVRLTELSPRESELYWANQYRVGTPEARRVFAQRTDRKVYSLRHPKLAGALTFSAPRSEVREILSKLLGAIDSRLIDGDIRKAGISEDLGIIESSDTDELNLLGQLLMGHTGDAVVEEEVDQRPKTAWSPFGKL